MEDENNDCEIQSSKNDEELAELASESKNASNQMKVDPLVKQVIENIYSLKFRTGRTGMPYISDEEMEE